MTRPTFTDQEIRNLAGRLRAANCEPGTDQDAYDASYAIEQLLRERGHLRSIVEAVQAYADLIESERADFQDSDQLTIEKAKAYDDIHQHLTAALKDVAW